MAVSQMWFITCKCPARLFPGDCSADFLSANIIWEYFDIVFHLANQTASVIAFFDFLKKCV